MNETPSHPAIQVLQSFFAEMHSWETEAYRGYKAINWQSVTREEVNAEKAMRRKQLEEIFVKYCEAGSAAKRLEGTRLSCQDPPAYDPAKESIVSLDVKRAKAVVETKQAFGFRWKKRYELVERDGSWKIRDNAKSAGEASPKWSSDIL
jgi:NTF2 fold immunity protein